MTPASRRYIVAASLVVVLGTLGVVGYIWSGAYDVGADEPHWRATYALLDTVRDRSIEARAKRLDVPADLSDPVRIRQGAGNYAAMCAGCHLSPGEEATEMSRGLYPAPPRLARTRVPAAETFWAIKHGIKASGMPAWGKSMDDASIWSLVAFLQALPKLDPPRYEALVASSGGHSHGGGGMMPHHHEGGAGHHEADHHDADEGEGAAHSHEPETAPHIHAPGTPPHEHGTSDQAPAGTSTPPAEPATGQQEPHHDHEH